jgi:hypothetical protein
MRAVFSPRPLVALLLGAVWFVSMNAADAPGTAMARAGSAFAAALTPEQRSLALFPLESKERLAWHFIPTEMFPRHGLTIKEMTEPQRRLAHDLLKTGLSERGYLTASSIMELENVLRVLEAGGQFVRDPERYFVSVFGTPAAKGAWGWRVEGHHLSLHFSVVDGAVAASAPTFFGTNPAEVRSGPQQGKRILAAQEDAGRALLNELTQTQRATAVINTTAPTDILTMNQLPITPLTPGGVRAADLTPPQRDALMRVVESYTGLMAPEIGADRLARIRKAGIEQVAFAWAGEAERGRKHYYRVQGPTFLIEFDNTQNDGNHIHSVWRDFNGDFGEDLLRQHLSAAHQ